MAKLLILAAALAAASPACAAIADGDASDAASGNWRLSDVGGRIACTLVLTGLPGVSGMTVRVPFACRRAFPPLQDLASWAPDGQGGIAFSDSLKRRIIVFTRQEGGTYEAKAPNGHLWRLEPARPLGLTAARDRMTGGFRLAGAGGVTLCDMTFTATIFGASGRVTSAVCTPSWAEKGFYAWTLVGGRLVLADRNNRTVLVLHGSPGMFAANDLGPNQIMLLKK